MAQIRKLINVNDSPKIHTVVSADYCFNEGIFQIRTYKDGDDNREENSKQNIQLNKEVAHDLIILLQQFVK